MDFASLVIQILPCTGIYINSLVLSILRMEVFISSRFCISGTSPVWPRLRMNEGVGSEQIKRTIITVTTISIVVKKKNNNNKELTEKGKKERERGANEKVCLRIEILFFNGMATCKGTSRTPLRRSRLFSLFWSIAWQTKRRGHYAAAEIVFESVVWRFKALCRS